jgi:hypothetical protein
MGTKLPTVEPIASPSQTKDFVCITTIILQSLSLAPLRSFTGFFEAEFAALFGARVALEEAGCFEFDSQGLIMMPCRRASA